ncbi:Uncharacterised protein [BD1-7 clade bacterium]|uniref:Uncharacterized protein n=1 Tax=BD1-7 clade bacterium TaxID=2029982 RepID=A0A5S9PQC5_9GAMM|nr:Uncharacterised protein [BD1-7 clade bacterium]
MEIGVLNDKRRKRHRLLGWITCILLCACESDDPDLTALYQTHQWPMTQEINGHYTQPPVIVIPGIMASELANAQGKNIWFGSNWETLFSNYQYLALDIDPDTLSPLPSPYHASGLPHSVLGFEIYGSLFDVLESIGQFQPTTPGEPLTQPQRRYYTLAYDWRYDNIDTVKALDALIEQIREDYKDPNLKVDIIAHSMGGLIARYYLRYGTVDVLDDNAFPVTQAGTDKIRRVIQLGTPNLGSVSAMLRLINGASVGFGDVPPEVLTTFPSLYQLLPHPINDWIINIQGKPLDRDLFDINIWRRFEWGIFNPKVRTRIIQKAATPAEGEAYYALLAEFFRHSLERARRFVWSLTVKVPNTRYDIIAFGGNCVPTPARILIEEIDGESVLRVNPDDIKHPIKGIHYDRLMYEPGDGAVTKPSLLARDYLNPIVERHEYSFFPLKYAFFLCNEHGSLTGNINFQDNLLNALLERRRQDMQTNTRSPSHSASTLEADKQTSSQGN